LSGDTGRTIVSILQSTLHTEAVGTHQVLFRVGSWKGISGKIVTWGAIVAFQ
jgi:hypothetical protein